ncbi:MAG: signal transduction histidine kinase, partial [Rhizobiaceae bacterium]|nr:signal transduction histidine kinase [Rhizobiaceae bacterium]
VLFDLLRHDPKTAGIPIHVISGAEHVDQLIDHGAASVSAKPVSSDGLASILDAIRESEARAQRTVLVVDPDADRRLSLVEAIRDGITRVTALPGVAAGAGKAVAEGYDAVVLGFGRSAKEDAQILEEAADHLAGSLPRLVFFSPYADVLQQAVALHPEMSEVPRAENAAQLSLLISQMLPGSERAGHVPAISSKVQNADLAGAKVLIIDDDIRNIYSLTSVLETYDIEVLHAERGRDGIALLEEMRDIDVALVDIMMPEMDGYETMREIRRRPEIADIPLISVTAKAMKGDRRKCLEAGASDYIAKPVDLDLLLALLRVWIGRARSRGGAELAAQ